MSGKGGRVVALKSCKVALSAIREKPKELHFETPEFLVKVSEFFDHNKCCVCKELMHENNVVMPCIKGNSWPHKICMTCARAMLLLEPVNWKCPLCRHPFKEEDVVLSEYQNSLYVMFRNLLWPQVEFFLKRVTKAIQKAPKGVEDAEAAVEISWILFDSDSDYFPDDSSFAQLLHGLRQVKISR